MRVISIEISNILSIEDALLTFDNDGLLLVEGWNYDTGRANGAGKTAIFNGISFALYDKVPRKITASEILRRGTNNGFAKCTVLCGQDTWQVIRRRPKGVEFIKNGVRVDITQKEFEVSLRLSYEQFLLSMYTAQSTNGGNDRFLLKSDTDKKTFLLRLLDLEKFSACKKLADSKIKVLTADIDMLLNKVENNKSKINAYEESLVDEASLKESIGRIAASITPLSAECNQLASVNKPDMSKFFKLEEDVRQRQDDIAQARAKREMLHEKYKTLQQDIEFNGDGSCLECGSPLDTAERRERHTVLHEKTLSELSNVKLSIDECDTTIGTDSTVADIHRRLRDKKQKETAAYQRASERLSELRALVRAKEVQLENLHTKMAGNTELKIKIKKLVQASEETEVTVIIKKNELQVFEIVAGIYSPTGAQAYILDSVVDLFNETIGDFVDKVWPSASYQIHSQKENSKGEMVAKFSETLTMSGTEVSVGSLSGGEFKALSLCVDFAILDVLSKQFGIDINPIILDEPFDGLDAVGKSIVINLLSKLSKTRQIIVVDHATEAKAYFPTVIRVENTNGISTVKVET